MSVREDTSDYRTLLLSGVPLLDTRSPVEFEKGAFPTAQNIPLMSDDERHLVGIRYKESGQQSAIELGNELVSGDGRQQRLDAWCNFARNNCEGYLYCFRGGLRSQTVQAWMQECGAHYPLVKGGYKAMRRFLLEELPRCLDLAKLVLISGKTGTGKTRVIDALESAIDLEGIARHRGSTFGRLLIEQPTQISFENTLITQFLQKLESGYPTLFLEDEGHLIGRVALPDDLRLAMKAAPMLVVEEPIPSRVGVVVDDYVIDLGRRFEAHFPGFGPLQHAQRLREDVAKIRKRLGGALHQQVDQQIQDAFALQLHTGDLAAHGQWIETLLLQYYDPMYEYQLSRREGKVLYVGDRAAVIDAAQSEKWSTA